MSRREKQCLYVLVPGAIFLAWRIVAIMGRVTPASAAAAPIPANPAPPMPAAVALDPTPAILGATFKSQTGEIVYADDPRIILQQAGAAPATWPRDPFYSPRLTERTQANVPGPAAEKSPAAPPWQLTGISVCDGRLAALLGDHIVTEGAVIDNDFKIVEITSNSVLVERNGWEFRYRLGQAKPETSVKGERRDRGFVPR